MATDRSEDDSPPVTNLDLKARSMLLAVLLLIAAVATYVLYARGFFERTQTVVLIAENAQGVVVGMDLTFAGFPIGRVDQIELSDQGNARIIVKVPVDDARWLRTSSVFTMESGLVGAPKLRAFSGILTDPPLEDGAERMLLAGDAMTEVQKLMSSIRDLVANLTALTGAESAVAKTLEQLQTTTTRLNGPQGALGLLFGNEKEARRIATTLDNANRLMLRLDGLVQKADRLTGRLDTMAGKADAQVFGSDGLVRDARVTVAQLNALLGEARGNLKKVDAILVDVQAISGQTRAATNDLASLRGEVEASLRKIEQLVNEVNRKWPFKRDSTITVP